MGVSRALQAIALIGLLALSQAYSIQCSRQFIARGTQRLVSSSSYKEPQAGGVDCRSTAQTKLFVASVDEVERQQNATKSPPLEQLSLLLTRWICQRLPTRGCTRPAARSWPSTPQCTSRKQVGLWLLTFKDAGKAKCQSS